MKKIESDIIIVGSGVAGLVAALEISKDKKIVLITKKEIRDSNSYLAQGGICVKKDENDREDFINDTLKAGQYEGNINSVETMVDGSEDAIETLIKYGVVFDKNNGKFSYTKEGGHGKNRILHCEDSTGKFIMEALIKEVEKRENIKIIENCSMEDILVWKNNCYGVYSKKNNEEIVLKGKITIFATGGIGGIYKNTTNFSHIQGDAIGLSKKYNIKLKDMSYIQIHPTALYEKNNNRRFLISESVRGEGAILLNKNKERFTDELKPRDIVSKAILEEMEKDNMEFMWLRMSTIKTDIRERFPKIVSYLNEIGIDPYKEDIPIVPAQHYTMGGIDVNLDGETSMENLYAIGEVSATGVHGKNRLASNSLLESVVFAKRTAKKINEKNYNYIIPEIFPIKDTGNIKIKESIREEIEIDKLAKAK